MRGQRAVALARRVQLPQRGARAAREPPQPRGRRGRGEREQPGAERHVPAERERVDHLSPRARRRARRGSARTRPAARSTAPAAALAALERARERGHEGRADVLAAALELVGGAAELVAVAGLVRRAQRCPAARASSRRTAPPAARRRRRSPCGTAACAPRRAGPRSGPRRRRRPDRSASCGAIHSATTRSSSSGRSGLDEVVVHARRQAALAVAGHRVRGHRDDRQPRLAGALALAGADRGGRGVAVELGHLAVHEDGVVGGRREHLERLAAVLGDVDGDPARGEHPLDHEPVDRRCPRRRARGRRPRRARDAVAVPVGGLALAGARSDRLGDGLQQPRAADRLGQHVLDPGLARRGAVVAGGGEHHELGAAQARRAADRPRQLQPVHAGHVVVEHDELERLAGAAGRVHQRRAPRRRGRPARRARRGRRGRPRRSGGWSRCRRRRARAGPRARAAPPGGRAPARRGRRAAA